MFGLSGPEPEDHIYVVNADGTGKRQLTTAPGSYRNPDWSPDGQTIIFSGSGAQGSGTYAMSADGANVRKLSAPGWSTGEHPTWSPDGGQIAFIRYAIHGTQTLCVMNADGSDLAQLTQSCNIWDAPVWSPDGSRLAYAVLGAEGDSVLLTNVDGSGQVDLSATAGPGESPTWSADGEMIAFETSGPALRIYAVSADGTDPVVLAARVGSREPAWSRDGERIAFLAGDQVYVMNADGTGQTAVTPAQRYEMLGGPIWCPDGQKLAFWAYPNGAPYPDLCVVNVDGTGLQTAATVSLREPAKKKLDLTSAFVGQNWRMLVDPRNWGGVPPSSLFVSGSYTCPSGFSWSPDGTKLVFVSMRRPGLVSEVLRAVRRFIAVPFLVLCAPAAVVLAIVSWRKQGLTRAAKIGLVAGGIPTAIYMLLLWLIGDTTVRY